MFESDTGPPIASFPTTICHLYILAIDIYVLSWAKLFNDVQFFFFLKE
jgi:hypothetical protein